MIAELGDITYWFWWFGFVPHPTHPQVFHIVFSLVKSLLFLKLLLLHL